MSERKPITADHSGHYVCECPTDEQHPDDDHLRVGTPEIYDYGEIPVLVRRDGRATNRWADGVAGVPTQLQERAELEAEAYCDDCRAYALWESVNTVQPELGGSGDHSPIAGSPNSRRKRDNHGRLIENGNES